MTGCARVAAWALFYRIFLMFSGIVRYSSKRSWYVTAFSLIFASFSSRLRCSTVQLPSALVIFSHQNWEAITSSVWPCFSSGRSAGTPKKKIPPNTTATAKTEPTAQHLRASEAAYRALQSHFFKVFKPFFQFRVPPPITLAAHPSIQVH